MQVLQPNKIYLAIGLIAASFLCFIIASNAPFLVGVWFLIAGSVTGVWAVLVFQDAYEEYKHDL
jgi:hypothetical protein